MGLEVISGVLFVSCIVTLLLETVNAQSLQDVPYIYVVDDPRCFGGRARQNYFHYDAELGNCVRCGSRCPEKSETNSHNNFERREDCMKICVCMAERGRSDLQARPRAMFQMWYFDRNTGNCTKFDYMGEKGNANRFLRQKDCQNTCT